MAKEQNMPDFKNYPNSIFLQLEIGNILENGNY